MSKKVILAVEDNPDALNLLNMMAGSLGYEVRPFLQPELALAELKEDAANGRTIHLALLDIMMPVMNGYELLAEIRKIPEYASVPIIMVTAKDQDSEVLDGYQHGADYYITKPFSRDQLKYGIDLYLKN